MMARFAIAFLALPSIASAESKTEPVDGPVLLPYEATPSHYIDGSLRGTGEAHGDDHDKRARIGADVAVGLSRNLAVGVSHAVIVDEDMSDDVIGGFDDLRLRGVLHGTTSQLTLLLVAEYGAPTRSSRLDPGDRRASAALTVAHEGTDCSVWLRPSASTRVEGPDLVIAGAELGGALAGERGLVAIRGAALQAYRDDVADRLTGFGSLLLAWRNPHGFVGVEIEGGFRPEGYAQLTLAVGLRGKGW
jgi:hypothetical protein